jgi:2,3-dihydroxybenzoate decarboxylase
VRARFGFVHPVNSEIAKNGKLEQVISNRGLSAFGAFLAASLRSRAALQIEILALCHQLNVLQRSAKRPRLSAVADRILFSNDYPYEDYAEGGVFMDTVAISESDRRKIAYTNAKALYEL